VLFSLPDLSETCQPTSPAASDSSPLADHADAGRELPTANVARPQIHDPQPEKTSKLLNAAIGFLAFAMLLIGLKLYTDRASERSIANERLLNSNAQTPSVQPTTTWPANQNQGPQRATYQTPVSTPNASPSNHSSESSNKAVLEISDPIMPASYLGEPSPTAPLTPISLPPASTPAASAPASSAPAIPVPPVSLPPTPVPVPILTLPPSTPQKTTSASSLNTRDMILLRQGKSIDLTQRDKEPNPVSLPVKPSSASAMKLTGETYPPVRQKYEPISISPSPPTVARPTSMEIPDPPKPYQPIGASFE
ncbi:MAG: hypothetical protein ACKO3V_11285, partial [Pirellula sp.]